METGKKHPALCREAASPARTRVMSRTNRALMILAVLVAAAMLSACAKAPEGDAVRSAKVGFTNIFFIPCDGGWLQIDVGYAGDYETYLKKVEEIGIDPSEVKYLLLTHHHDDHAGFAAEFVKKHDAVVIVHEKALAPLARGASEENMRPVNGCVKTLFSVFSRFHEFVFPPFISREKDLIIGGDNAAILRTIGVDGVILSTPGHTDDSISVVLADGTAFVGDVAMNFFGVCGIEHRPIYITDIDRVYESWARLQEFGATTIYPSHGEPFAAAELVPVR